MLPSLKRCDDFLSIPLGPGFPFSWLRNVSVGKPLSGGLMMVPFLRIHSKIVDPVPIKVVGQKLDPRTLKNRKMGQRRSPFYLCGS